MVCQKHLGPVIYKQEHGEYSYSEETARKIDDEVRSIMDSCYKQVVSYLRSIAISLRTLARADCKRNIICWRDLSTPRNYTSRRASFQ